MDIGILAGEIISDFNIAVIEQISKDPTQHINLFAINNSKKSSWEKLKKNLKRERGFYILIMLWKKLFSNAKNNISTKLFCKKNNYPYLEMVNPINDQDIKKISSYEIDVLINLGGFGIIKEPLLNHFSYGILSYHHGDMREYRGMPPAFWELYHNENKMGVTVQKLSKGLDCGMPIVEKQIDIAKNDTLKSLRKKAYSESVSMMHQAIKNLQDPSFTPDDITNYGTVYTLPNFREWLLLHFKILKRS